MSNGFADSMPRPAVDDDTQAFWDACRQHKLVVQRCGGCGEYRFAPAPICPGCLSFAVELVESCGNGYLYTWTVVWRPVHPAVQDAVPYNVVVVKLDDCGGALITSNLVDAPNEVLQAGLEVVLDWDDDRIDGFSLPVFRVAA